MTKELLKKIIENIGSENLEDSVYIDPEYPNRYYTFDEVEGSDSSWTAEGKYEYKIDEGRLSEYDDKKGFIQSLPYVVKRDVYRSGSYFTGYHYEEGELQVFEVKEVVVPEVIIPEHTEEKLFKIEL